jgi:hypothetical protein
MEIEDKLPCLQENPTRPLCAIRISSKNSYPPALTFILISSSSLRLGFQSLLFLLHILINFYTFLISSMKATFPANLIFLHSITQDNKIKFHACACYIKILLHIFWLSPAKLASSQVCEFDRVCPVIEVSSV